MHESPQHWSVELEALLRQRIGLNPDSIGGKQVRAVATLLMATRGVSDPHAYVAELRSNNEVFQQFVERVVVSESWFFRDLKPFQFLEESVATRLRSLALERPLRLLSVPCCAGEEPLSMALTLLHQGIAPDRIHVDAIDISQHALDLATTGSFGKSSFREPEQIVPHFRTKYFRPDGDRWKIHDEILALVHFHQGNLVDPGFLQGERPFDVIFCRNLFIYLDDKGRRAALTNLHRLLDRDGTLFVGHVEAGSVQTYSFAPRSPAYPFAFRPLDSNETTSTALRSAVKRSPTVRLPRPKSPFVGTPPVVHAPFVSTAPSVGKSQSVAAAPVADAQEELAAARQAANAGRLTEAASQCDGLLAHHALNADVFCLLGVVRRAQGDLIEAEKCFQKAVYLNPRQHEALVHLALLARQRGDVAGAKNYERRADKAKGDG